MRKLFGLFGPYTHYLFAAALAAICLLGMASTRATAAGLVYVEADDGFAGTPNLSPLTAIDSENLVLTEIDNLWGYRALGSGAVVFESSNTGNPGAENSPELTMTLNATNGLVSGASYDIYVAFWSATGQNWSIQGNLPGGTAKQFNRTGPLAFLPNAIAGASAASAIWTTPPALTVEVDRVMLLGKVGTATATGGQISVLIDDLPTTAYPVDIPPANAFTYRSWFDGVAFIEAGKSLTLEATIDRNDGKLSLVNNTGNPVSFTSISITSASQALSATSWRPITNFYDQGAGLDTDPWEITVPTLPLPAFAPALTEIESVGGTGGATMASGAPEVNLGTVWKDTRFSDVQIQVTLLGGAIVNITPTYIGPAHQLGDLSNNGTRGIEDYQILTSNMHKSFTTLGQAEAYLKGDMNGDLTINYADFVAFRAAFPGSGAGSFESVIGQVPEPTTALLLAVGVFMLSVLRAFGRMRLRPDTRVCLAVTPSELSNSIRHISFRTSSMMSTRALRFLAALAAMALLPAVEAQAINVTMTGTDALGGTSFNAAGFWNNAAAPSAGNAYITANFGLRTPADANSYTFAGDSLRVNNTNFDPMVPATPAGGLWYKGTGNTGVITINNLILDGGLITHINGPADLFQLAGNINVVSNSYIQGRQGAINILANVSGSATITNPSSDGAGRIVRFMSPANTFSGSIVNNGRIEFPDNARMNFTIGANGVNNSISGTGAETILNGDFNINTAGANATLGNSWSLVSATNRVFGPTFDVPGFFEYSTGTWINGNFQFSETTGALTVAPAPDLLTLRVNKTNGQVSIKNNTTGANFNMNYYELRSASGSLDTVDWTSIDGNIPTTTTSWEKAGGSTANLISETNLQGMQSLAATNSVGIGSAFSGTLPTHEDLQFFYGTSDTVGTLFRGYVEYFTSTAVTGDYNGDGKVNAADYTVWRDTLGSPVTQGTGADGNNNSQIDPGDYTIWKNNFGNPGSGGGQLASGSQVPEPTTLLLAVVVMGWGANFRRQRGGE